MAFWFEGIKIYGGNLFSPVVKQTYNLDNAISYDAEYLPSDFKMIDENGKEVELDDADVRAENSRTKFDLLTIRFIGDAEPIKLVVTSETITHIRGASWRYSTWRENNLLPYPYDEDE